MFIKFVSGKGNWSLIATDFFFENHEKVREVFEKVYNHAQRYTVQVTISYHLFRFLIGQYSVAKIWYFIKNEMKLIQTQIFWWKTRKKYQESICKYKVSSFHTILSFFKASFFHKESYCELAPLTRDVT